MATASGAWRAASSVVRIEPSASQLAASAGPLPIATAPAAMRRCRATRPYRRRGPTGRVVDRSEPRSRTRCPSRLQAVGCRSPSTSGRSKACSVPSASTTSGRHPPGRGRRGEESTGLVGREHDRCDRGAVVGDLPDPRAVTRDDRDRRRQPPRLAGGRARDRARVVDGDRGHVARAGLEEARRARARRPTSRRRAAATPPASSDAANLVPAGDEPGREREALRMLSADDRRCPAGPWNGHEAAALVARGRPRAYTTHRPSGESHPSVRPVAGRREEPRARRRPRPTGGAGRCREARRDRARGRDGVPRDPSPRASAARGTGPATRP